jgi:fatty acid amide hydrolase 2
MRSASRAHDLRLLSGSQLARLIRDGVITSREAVACHMAQIRAVNPVLNAVVRERFDEALREADAADAALARSTSRNSLPRFHGVPCTVKECFSLTGMPNSAGLVSRRAVVSTADATAVARVRQAGAIPLGVTNVSELCMWMETNNYVYGRTNNPYSPRRIAGGSSGGEGAIIGAGASPFGIGSDIGGSIRGPAFFNGVFGHKPTGGLVPGTGQHPTPSDGARRILTTGPLARRAEDLMPLLEIMAGPDGADPGCAPFSLGDPSAVDISRLNVLNVEDNGALRVSRDLAAAQAHVAEALSARGAKVTTRAFPALRKQFEIWSAMLAEQQEVDFGTMLGAGRRIRPLWELLKWSGRRSDHTAMAILLALVDPLPQVLPGLQKSLVQLGRSLRSQLMEAIGEHGVMLYPSYTSPAPRHGLPLLHALLLRFPFAYQGIMNVLELPATQVPLGLNAQGLPLGIQVAAIHGHDHLTIAVALELERRFGGWTPPFLARGNLPPLRS